MRRALAAVGLIGGLLIIVGLFGRGVDADTNQVQAGPFTVASGSDPNALSVDETTGQVHVGRDGNVSGKLTIVGTTTDEPSLMLRAHSSMTANEEYVEFQASNGNPIVRFQADGDVILDTGTLTSGSNLGAGTGDGALILYEDDGNFSATLQPAATFTGSHTFTLPDATGTVAVSGTAPVTLSAAGAVGLDQTANYTWTGTHSLTGADVAGATPLRFEGVTADDVFTSFAITDPNAARMITFPNASGTVALGTPTDDAILIGDGTNFAIDVMTDCKSLTTSKVLYDAGANNFFCGTDSTSGGTFSAGNTLWVTTDGNDDPNGGECGTLSDDPNTGAWEGPCATPQQAIANYDNSSGTTGYVIQLAPGIYDLSDPVIFARQCSGGDNRVGTSTGPDGTKCRGRCSSSTNVGCYRDLDCPVNETCTDFDIDSTCDVTGGGATSTQSNACQERHNAFVTGTNAQLRFTSTDIDECQFDLSDSHLITLYGTHIATLGPARGAFCTTGNSDFIAVNNSIVGTTGRSNRWDRGAPISIHGYGVRTVTVTKSGLAANVGGNGGGDAPAIYREQAAGNAAPGLAAASGCSAGTCVNQTATVCNTTADCSANEVCNTACGFVSASKCPDNTTACTDNGVTCTDWFCPTCAQSNRGRCIAVCDEDSPDCDSHGGTCVMNRCKSADMVITNNQVQGQGNGALFPNVMSDDPNGDPDLGETFNTELNNSGFIWQIGDDVDALGVDDSFCYSKHTADNIDQCAGLGDHSNIPDPNQAAACYGVLWNSACTDNSNCVTGNYTFCSDDPNAPSTCGAGAGACDGADTGYQVRTWCRGQTANCVNGVDFIAGYLDGNDTPNLTTPEKSLGIADGASIRIIQNLVEYDTEDVEISGSGTVSSKHLGPPVPWYSFMFEELAADPNEGGSANPGEGWLWYNTNELWAYLNATKVEILTGADAGDGLEYTGTTPDLNLDLEAAGSGTGGLAIDTGELRVDVGDGIELTAGGVAVDLSATPGLLFNAGLEVDDGNGVQLDGGKVAVDLGAGTITATTEARGLGFSSGELKLVLQGTTLDVGNGLRIKLDGHDMFQHANSMADAYLTDDGTGGLDVDAEVVTDTKCITDVNPVDADDLLWFRTNNAITITALDCISEDATNTPVTVVECDANGNNCGSGSTRLDESMTCLVTNTADDGAIGNPTVAAGAWFRLQVGAPSGSPGHVAVCMTFTKDDTP